MPHEIEIAHNMKRLQGTPSAPETKPSGSPNPSLDSKGKGPAGRNPSLTGHKGAPYNPTLKPASGDHKSGGRKGY